MCVCVDEGGLSPPMGGPISSQAMDLNWRVFLAGEWSHPPRSEIGDDGGGVQDI